MMDTRRWGPGERIVFEPYSKEVFEQSFDWIAKHRIFADGGDGIGRIRPVHDLVCGGVGLLSTLRAERGAKANPGSTDRSQSV